MSTPQNNNPVQAGVDALHRLAASLGIPITTSTDRNTNPPTASVTTTSNVGSVGLAKPREPSGGNLVQWLSQQTQFAPPSKGAVEYLTKLSQPSIPTGTFLESNGPRKGLSDVKQMPPAMKINPPVGSHVDPPLSSSSPTDAKMSLQELEENLRNTHAGGKSSLHSLFVPSSSSENSVKAGENLLGSLFSGLSTAQKGEVNMIPEKRGDTAPVQHQQETTWSDKGLAVSKTDAHGPSFEGPPPPYTSPTADGNTLPLIPLSFSNEGNAGGGQYRGPAGTAKGETRRLRGRRRRDGAERVGKRKMEAEALRRHREALRCDPEYQHRYQTAQELHREMLEAQAGFMEKYQQQEAMVNLARGIERLDIPVILELIEHHDVVFICTDTGTGKSTNIPRALLELSPDTRVVSTQPRRTATIAIANRVSSLRGENVGEDVGYWIRGEKQGDEETRLWYMTSYTLLLRLLENPTEIPYTHIILDEFHERQPDLEVMAALVRLALLEKPGKLKLILMSATLNTENWEEYFSGLKVATYKQSEPDHPIHDFFLEDTCKLLGHDYTPPPQLLQRQTVDKHMVDTQMYLAENLIVFLNMTSHPSHSILVFLPGRAQVERMQIVIESRLRQRADVIPWHSAVDLSTIESAMKRVGGGTLRQKIYLATDIAEVSITLPDVVFVVDLGLVKRPQIRKDVPSTILYPPLLMKWIVKGSLAQRRGRVGRVQQGFYFCLLPAQQIQYLPNYAEPPIENSRIDELSLHCLEVVSNPAAVYSICRGQPLMESIVSSMNALTQIGCILDTRDPCAKREWILGVCDKNAYWNSLIVSRAEKEIQGEIVEFQCTFLGRLLQLIPVSLQQGLLVFYGFFTGLESLMILAAAVTSSLSPFTIAGQEGGSGKGKHRANLARAMEETENVLRDMCCGLRSDVIAVMKAVLLFRMEQERHGVGSPIVQGWCLQKNLSYEKLVAITDLENHIKYELAEFLPFRDIVDPGVVLEQLEKTAATVAVMLNVAFVAQAVEVMSEGLSYNTMETAVGIFSDLFAVPDIHSPSCFRWLEGDLIIPVQLSLSYDKLLASFSTAIKTYKQFWASLLLLSFRVNYATFSDEDGKFHVFSVEYGGKKRFVEMDEEGGNAVIAFRSQLCEICQNLHIAHLHKNIEDESAMEEEMQKVMAKHRIRPLLELQREVITSLVNFFAELDSYVADEVEHTEDDLDSLSILSFGLSPPA